MVIFKNHISNHFKKQHFDIIKRRKTILIEIVPSKGSFQFDFICFCSIKRASLSKYFILFVVVLFQPSLFRVEVVQRVQDFENVLCWENNFYNVSSKWDVRVEDRVTWRVNRIQPNNESQEEEWEIWTRIKKTTFSTKASEEHSFLRLGIICYLRGWKLEDLERNGGRTISLWNSPNIHPWATKYHFSSRCTPIHRKRNNQNLSFEPETWVIMISWISDWSPNLRWEEGFLL